MVFEEFNLSKSNAKLGKRTFIEYVQNKENNLNVFRARSVDKKIYQAKTPKVLNKKRKLTEFSPFNFKTEERKAFKQQNASDESDSFNGF